MIHKDLQDELKYEIIFFLNEKCFRCNRIRYYLNDEICYRFFPPFLNNDEHFKGYPICSLCLFLLQMTSRFSNKGMLSYS